MRNLLLLAAGVGAGYYFFVYRPKQLKKKEAGESTVDPEPRTKKEKIDYILKNVGELNLSVDGMFEMDENIEEVRKQLQDFTGHEIDILYAYTKAMTERPEVFVSEEPFKKVKMSEAEFDFAKRVVNQIRKFDYRVNKEIEKSIKAIKELWSNVKKMAKNADDNFKAKAISRYQQLSEFLSKHDLVHCKKENEVLTTAQWEEKQNEVNPSEMESMGENV